MTFTFPFFLAPEYKFYFYSTLRFCSLYPTYKKKNFFFCIKQEILTKLKLNKKVPSYIICLKKKTTASADAKKTPLKEKKRK